MRGQLCVRVDMVDFLAEPGTLRRVLMACAGGNCGDFDEDDEDEHDELPLDFARGPTPKKEWFTDGDDEQFLRAQPFVGSGGAVLADGGVDDGEAAAADGAPGRPTVKLCATVPPGALGLAFRRGFNGPVIDGLAANSPVRNQLQVGDIVRCVAVLDDRGVASMRETKTASLSVDELNKLLTTYSSQPRKILVSRVTVDMAEGADGLARSSHWGDKSAAPSGQDKRAGAGADAPTAKPSSTQPAASTQQPPRASSKQRISRRVSKSSSAAPHSES